MRQEFILREGWHLKEVEEGTALEDLLQDAQHPGGRWMPARMPAQVHDILLEHLRIPDPRIGKNAAEVAWVGWRDWAYTCHFVTPTRADGPAILRFKGLDTLASAYLNGHLIGDFDNMFRVWGVEVSDQLAPEGEENVLLVYFRAPHRAIEAIQQPPEHAEIIKKNKYIRKSAQDFGSYLGPRPDHVKVGIFDQVILDIPDRAWFEDVWARASLSDDLDQATILVDTETAGAEAQLAWSLADPSDEILAQGSTASGHIEIPVGDPELWWPWTHGSQPLYTLSLQLVVDGEACDEREVQVGIRSIRLEEVDPATCEPRFKFWINGQPIWLMGAGLAPIEGMTYCWDHQRAVQLLDMAQGANMNLLRVWGGGTIADDKFYDECDQRGILIWQDFTFGYGTYPDDDPAFNENVRLEVEGLVRRLRNHPSILLWVGGNENHMGYDFAFGGQPPVGRKLFEEIMAEACARMDPTRPYHPSSPFGGPAPNWPLEGDWHDYTTVTFSHQASVPLFASEIGRASAVPLKSMRRFMTEEEIWPTGYDARIREPGQPAWPPMWQYRSVNGSWEKVGAVEEFLDPVAPEELIRVLGTAHGECLRNRIERERRGMPNGGPDGRRRCWGNMVWRLNDSWPILYWSVIDYYLEPKIAYDFLRRAYAPVLLSFEQTPDELNVWVINDGTSTVSGELVVQRMRFDGTLRGELQAPVRVGPGESARCINTTPLGPISLRHEFLRAQLGDLQATHLLMGERYLNLPRAHLAVQRGEGWIRISTDVFARQVTLDTEQYGVIQSDNHFDLAPDETKQVRILYPAGVDTAAIRVTCLNAYETT